MIKMVKVRVNQLIWDDWNINHIKKHSVKPNEVEKTLKSKIKTLKSYKERLLVLGRCGKRLLTIVLAKEKNNKYYVVTARDMSKKERRYYGKNA